MKNYKTINQKIHLLFAMQITNNNNNINYTQVLTITKKKEKKNT